MPETSDPTKQYQMVGIPDGLGAHGNPNGTTTVFMNHELPAATLSEPVLGDPLNRGAIVSKLILDRDGDVLSGERAYDWVPRERVPRRRRPRSATDTRPFSRFCSGALVGPAEGFDRYIYMTNEEEGTPANSYDGLGGPDRGDLRQRHLHAAEARPLRLGELARSAAHGQRAR